MSITSTASSKLLLYCKKLHISTIVSNKDSYNFQISCNSFISFLILQMLLIQMIFIFS